MKGEWLWGLVLFARAILFGAALGIYYEVFRIFRTLLPHPVWLVAVEDLLFLLPATVAQVFFHFAYGEGETRWFAVLGVVLGFLLYLASAGKVVQKLIRHFKTRFDRIILDPIKRRFDALKDKRKQRTAARRERRLKRNHTETEHKQ